MASKCIKEAVTDKRVKQKKKSRVSSSEDVSSDKLHSAVAQANKIGELLDKRLSFDIDRKTNKVIVKVIDKSTGEIVRVVQPGQMLRMAAHLKQLKVLNDRVIGAAESVILDHEC